MDEYSDITVSKLILPFIKKCKRFVKEYEGILPQEEIDALKELAEEGEQEFTGRNNNK